ncbi:MAG: RAMP superfamily CRISPR-associated protein, partial [Bacteroidota bacterium]
MTPISENVRCRIETLTPVHIGSGVTLKRDIDFVVEGGDTTVVAQRDAIAWLAQQPADVVNRFTYNPDQFLNEIDGAQTFPLAVRGAGSTILAQLREASGRLLVPGSSIKGGLRSVILNYLWLGESEDTQTRLLNGLKPSMSWASQSIQKALLGKDPNHDWLRALTVRDVSFPDRALDLLRCQILTLTSPDGT